MSLRRPLALVLAVCLIASTALTLVLSQISPASAARTKAAKFEVCHRTNAIKNPYRLINVAWSSVDPNGTGHDNSSHDGPVFNVSNPVGSHGTTPRDSGLGSEAGGGNDRWGDIFNAVKGPGNGNSNSNNWTTAGQAIFNGTATFTINGVTKKACRAMTANEFIKAEKEENPSKPMSQIMTDLDGQGASEDAALIQALGGGSFSSWYTNNGGGSEDPNLVTSLIAADSPGVTTEPPTNIAATSATLNGTISPQGASMVWYFEWSSNVNWRNDPTSVVPNETNPSSATTTAGNVTSGLTGLSSGTTYYYRTVGVVTTGSASDDTLVETYLYGAIKQFVNGAPAAPTINSLTCGNTKVTVAFTANANVTNVTGYEYSVDGAAYQNSGVNGATLAGGASATFDISGLTNGVSVSVAIRAITSSVKGIDSLAVTGSACGDPDPVTQAATNVQKQTATINGTVTANGATTGVTFTWGTDPQLGGTPTTTSANPGSLTPTDILPVSLNLTGLTGGTTYYFRVNATRASGGPWNGQILSFVTPNVVLPVTTTTAATSVTTTSATLNGTGTSNGPTSSDTSTVTFKWGTDPTLTNNTVANAAQNPLASTATGTAVSTALTNLIPYTTYYFRTFITRGSDTAEGAILSFTTLPEPPVAVTNPASSVTETTATLNGNGDPNLFTSDVTFEWGTDPTLSSNTQVVNAAETPLQVGASPVPVTLNLTGLTGGITYYFRVIVTNTNGTSTGNIRSFTTLTPIAPAATTTVPAPTTTTTVPATTTTPAPTTTTVPTTVAPAATNEIGRVIGTAWFDTNKNNKRDNNEPLISSLPIELVPTGATSQAAGKVRKTAMSMITGSDGSFDFASVIPGTYRIIGDLPAGYGIDKSWDTTGNDDWAVSVTVVASKVARGDFAAVGTASMSGCYSGRTEARQMAVTWDGFDKKLGTTDDATFASAIGNDCNFEVQGVPTGKFEVAAKSAEGEVVAKTTMAVTSSGGTVKTASLSVNAKIQKVLPQTGSRQMSDLMVLAMYALVTGAAIVMTSRRRRRLG